MDFAFPHPVSIQSNEPKLEQLRRAPFMNVDGELFATPQLNGRWRIDMSVLARTQHGELALSAFITGMSQAGAFCNVPICTKYRPNASNGRMLSGNQVRGFWFESHVGWKNDPFGGYRAIADAAVRDSYIDISAPDLGAIIPGMFISLGRGRLHKVLKATHVGSGQRDNEQRLHIAPNLRDPVAAGDVIIVDQLVLRCWLDTSGHVPFDGHPHKRVDLSFVEAF